MSEHANRRDFLKTVSAGVGGGLIPGKVLGANDVLNVGVIGVGGRGTSLLREVMRMGEQKGNVRVVAYCDVYQKRLTESSEICPEGTAYRRYKDLLEHPDLDVVVIATPPHWHAKMSIDACKAGKDVYCEKPFTQTLDEAKDVQECVRKTGQVFQVGSQTTSRGHWHQAANIIQSGVLGKLVMIQGSHHRNSVNEMWDFRMIGEAGPDQTGDNYIDWKEWLGPSKKVKWDKDNGADRFFRFRKYWEYSSGGVAGDLLYHNLAPVYIAMGGEKAPFPLRVTGTGGISLFKGAETSDIFTITADYASGFQLVFSCTILNGLHVPGYIRGHKASINLVSHGVFERDVPSFSVFPEPLFKDEFRDKCDAAGLTGEWSEVDYSDVSWKRRDQIVPQLTMTTEKRPTHMENFLQCVRDRQQPVLTARAGYKIQTVISMAVKSFVEGKMVYFDQEKEKIRGRAPRQKYFT
jgi:predicted dehydrogenase